MPQDAPTKTYPPFIHDFFRFPLQFRVDRRISGITLGMSRPAGPGGLKGSAKGESPAAPFVTEMARAVIGQKGDDTSIITPNLDLVSMRPTATS